LRHQLSAHGQFQNQLAQFPDALCFLPAVAAAAGGRFGEQGRGPEVEVVEEGFSGHKLCSFFCVEVSHKNSIIICAISLWRFVMQRATVTLPQDLLTELVTLVGAKSKTEAVITAVKDEIRLRKMARIKSMAGKMEFTATADELRHGDSRLG
jgi:hypothetical protein